MVISVKYCKIFDEKERRIEDQLTFIKLFSIFKLFSFYDYNKLPNNMLITLLVSGIYLLIMKYKDATIQINWCVEFWAFYLCRWQRLTFSDVPIFFFFPFDHLRLWMQWKAFHYHLINTKIHTNRSIF